MRERRCADLDLGFTVSRGAQCASGRTGDWNADFQGGDGRGYEIALCLDRGEPGIARVPDAPSSLLRSLPVEVLAEAIGRIAHAA
jgi:hypothetical protein